MNPLYRCVRGGWDGKGLPVCEAGVGTENCSRTGPFRCRIWLLPPTLSTARRARACRFNGGGQEGERLHLFPSAPPPPPWLPDGARAGRGRQETTGAAAGLTSCLTPEKGKVPQPPPKLGWGLGGQPALFGWVGFSLHALPCHTLGTHSAFSGGRRGETVVNGGEEERQSGDPGRIRPRKQAPEAEKKFCATSLRLREPKDLPQGHTAEQQWLQASSPGDLSPELT